MRTANGKGAEKPNRIITDGEAQPGEPETEGKAGDGVPNGKGKPRSQKNWSGSVYFNPYRPMPDAFKQAGDQAASLLGTPVLYLLQTDYRIPKEHEAYGEISPEIYQDLLKQKAMLPREPITVILDSPGGDAGAAYQIARLLTKVCGGYNVFIPRYAKSAATLLSLGADKVILGPHAELGPLDMQIFDAERESYSSALDEVQALERMNKYALESIDQFMLLFLQRSRKSVNTLLPMSLDYVVKMMRPLLEKIDTVHYSQMSRGLKVGEDYAFRLLAPRYGELRAQNIATTLVEKYSTHGFVIDHEEARSIGLQTELTNADLETVADEMTSNLVSGITFVGFPEEINEKAK